MLFPDFDLSLKDIPEAALHCVCNLLKSSENRVTRYTPLGLESGSYDGYKLRSILLVLFQ
jgi:hypothetical protein